MQSLEFLDALVLIKKKQEQTAHEHTTISIINIFAPNISEENPSLSTST